ncbi:MAG TPA: elongation factor EF-2, partial [Halobacteria archaeon]|nr:elongation factor EF-2 [Halobacteria archaeon]
MVSRKEIVEKIKKLMDKTENIRNIGIVAHIDHGKTTLSDNLLAGSGIISSELAGKMLFMDYDEEEQARGITINAANVSILFNHKETDIDYLINLIDTPGHVDFGGDVTRAMRAVDGCIVVVDAVEGMMPQTETVLKQALKENVKPVLFVNKVDRLINELKIDKKDMQYRLAKVIEEVNKFIRNIQKEKYESGWKINPADGSVAFGSALYKWAISIPMLEKTGIGFNEVYDCCVSGRMRELAEKSPLYNIVFDMVVKHLPNPLVSQKRRIPTIWHGDLDSEIGRSMLNCEKNGPIIFMVTKIVPDPHAGEVATGRLFSGTLKRGMELYISNVNRTNKAQQVGIYMGPDRVEVEEIPAGNIIAVTGLKDAIVGSTVSTVEDIVPFEEIRHVSEPVVTVAVEAKNMKDLPRLIEVLREVSKEDPTVQVQIDEESGEHLISGMGELHLEVIGHKIERDKKVPIITSEPIVVYRESISSKGGPTEGVSPNRHNRFYMEVEPLSESVVELLKSGAFSMKLPELERRKLLMDAGFNTDEAKAVVDEYKNNLLLNMTKGIQYLPETMELIIEG